jgi:hypothetical protein
MIQRAKKVVLIDSVRFVAPLPSGIVFEYSLLELN